VRTRGSSRGANQPAAGKAGIARPLAIEHYCPGLPEPARWARDVRDGFQAYLSDRWWYLIETKKDGL
jgi:hypothetical protein